MIFDMSNLKLVAPDRMHVSKRQSGVILFYEVNFFFFVKRVHSLRNQQTRYVCQKMNFIVVGSHGYYYFIRRFLIFNFSCLPETEGVRQYLEKDLGTFFFTLQHLCLRFCRKIIRGANIRGFSLLHVKCLCTKIHSTPCMYW
jgi:hypothetical protein